MINVNKIKEKRNVTMLINMAILGTGAIICGTKLYYCGEFQYAVFSIYFLITSIVAFRYSDRREYEVWDKTITESPLVAAILTLLSPFLVLFVCAGAYMLNGLFNNFFREPLSALSFIPITFIFFMPVIYIFVFKKTEEIYRIIKLNRRSIVRPIPPLWFAIVIYVAAMFSVLIYSMNAFMCNLTR